jgi:hypothetical protein
LKTAKANFFKTMILPTLPVSLLKPFFCYNNGRPTKDLLTMLGLYLLQEMWDLTDVEVLHRLQFDLSFRWALDIRQGNDSTLYVSPRTFYNFRRLMKENDLDSLIFNDTTAALLNTFAVNYKLQRLDLGPFQHQYEAAQPAWRDDRHR